MNMLLRKVTTPQVIPSGTGQTVSTKSSKNMGTLLFKKTPSKMQDAYNVAATKTKANTLHQNVLCFDDDDKD